MLRRGSRGVGGGVAGGRWSGKLRTKKTSELFSVNLALIPLAIIAGSAHDAVYSYIHFLQSAVVSFQVFFFKEIFKTAGLIWSETVCKADDERCH